MLKVTKEVKLTMDGEDVKMLRGTCELARIYLQDHRDEIFAGGGMSKDDRRQIANWLSEIFDNT